MRPTRPVNTLPAPTSTKVSIPASAIASIRVTNRTGAPIWRASTAAGDSSYTAALSPDHTGTVGSVNSTPSRKSANGAELPATTGEWKAVATVSRWNRIPALLRACSAASIPSVVPEITTCSGALWFATTTSGPRNGVTASRVAVTAVIAPGASAAAAMSSPRRRATARKAASSRAPAACSALTSPKL